MTIAAARIRLATIPDDHPYLDAVIPAEVQRVRFPATGWAPSPLLSAARHRHLLAGIDVVHVHFGYESLTAAELAEWLAVLRAASVPVVLTAHDLRLPHHTDRRSHDAALGLLLAAAAEVITLTPGAAAELHRRWHRSSVVLGHPSLLPAGAVGAQPDITPTVGIHLKNLRPNIVDPLAVIHAAAVGAERAGAVLRVDLHDELVGSRLARQIDAVSPTVQLHSHARFDDQQLLEYLQHLTVSVLPYRFGTHSGWLELCRDLGVTAVVPDCGYYREQWPAAIGYRNNEQHGLDRNSLTSAVHSALSGPRPAPADAHRRARERSELAVEHGLIYRRVAERAA